ncbi:MAG TPA: cobalamin B12-binding domain-containing protein [Limnochorda sp.]
MEQAMMAPSVTPATARIRVLLAKMGLDGHDRGIKVLARGLRDRGMEVVYLGMRLTPEQVAEAAVQEDPDVIGVSLLSGAHMRLMASLMAALKDRGLHDTIVILGGVIPQRDVEPLKSMGVQAVFTTGARLDDIADTIRRLVVRRRG